MNQQSQSNHDDYQATPVRHKQIKSGYEWMKKRSIS